MWPAGSRADQELQRRGNQQAPRPLTDFIKQNQSNISATLANMNTMTTDMAEGGNVWQADQGPDPLQRSGIGGHQHEQRAGGRQAARRRRQAMVADMRKMVTKMEKGEARSGA